MGQAGNLVPSPPHQKCTCWACAKCLPPAPVLGLDTAYARAQSLDAPSATVGATNARPEAAPPIGSKWSRPLEPKEAGDGAVKPVDDSSLSAAILEPRVYG